MEQDHQKEIEEIIGHTKCPKDFQCHKQGLEDQCQAKDIGLPSFVECLGENTAECISGCRFGYPLGHSVFCHCPLRVYITKRLKK
jgi:hypothetical protein